MSSQVQNTKPDGKKQILIGGILIGLSFFGIPALLALTLTNLLLGHPEVNTTGRAIVNISAVSAMALCIIIGFVFALVGTVRAAKSK